MDSQELLDELRSSHDTATNYVADCIEDYLAADYGGDDIPEPELIRNACMDIILAASGALKHMP